jgi:hypothetical protein
MSLILASRMGFVIQEGVAFWDAPQFAQQLLRLVNQYWQTL